jgi:hypothetical protein
MRCAQLAGHKDDRTPKMSTLPRGAGGARSWMTRPRRNPNIEYEPGPEDPRVRP